MTKKKLFDLIKLSIIAENGEIPNTNFSYYRSGIRRGQEALLYHIPNNKGGNKYLKGVNIDEFYDAFLQLNLSNQLNSKWFKNNLPACQSEGGCNFKFIGGCFIKVGLIKNYRRGCFY